MNIDTSKINQTQKTSINSTKVVNQKGSSAKFADELKECQNEEKITSEEAETNLEENITAEESDAKNIEDKETKTDISEEKELEEALKDMNSIVKEFNQTDENGELSIKNEENSTDNNYVINKDFNIQDKQDLLPQMNPNMNFSGNGQPFSSFMNNSANQNAGNSANIIGTNAQDLAEEAAILSTMAENIAIANKNHALKESRTVMNEEGIKKVETQSGIKIETVVKYDTVIMNQADVEMFATLVEKGEVKLDNLAPKAAEQSVQVSKTLADMLAKSMEKNQPVRIDFDNNISVIIKISRDGKITADFLPSSQVAEAYLKENLPLLKQRFDENNIKYDSLNQRERREHKDSNRKKDRNNE